MRPVLAFDLIGTLLDLSALDPFFTSHFDSVNTRREWFLELTGLANLATITCYFEPFTSLTSAALDMVANRHGIALSKTERTEFQGLLTTLPAYPEVLAALERLQDSKFRLMVLTNSSPSATKTLLDATDIAPYLEMVMTTEEFQLYKPHETIYHRAAERMKVMASGLMMVSAHAWDTTGAVRAGCDAAFLQRSGRSLPPGAPKPRIIAHNLSEFADKLCKEYSK